jgi:predicted  nucleic acid-binding Zn-ribbon protein
MSTQEQSRLKNREDEWRQEFHDLGARKQEIHDTSEPLRAERDKISQEADRKLKELSQQIKEAEKDLFEIDQQRAALCRALGGRTGECPTYLARNSKKEDEPAES